MLYMVILYLLTEKIGFGLEMQLSYYLSAAITAVILVVFIIYVRKTKEALTKDSLLINDHLPIKAIYPELLGNN